MWLETFEYQWRGRIGDDTEDDIILEIENLASNSDIPSGT